MKKKILAGAVTLLSVATLAACSQSAGNNTDIITMKGDTITVGEFYNKVKNNTAAQQVLLNLTVKEVFEKKYGKHVSDKEVEEVFNKNKSNYGNAFAQVLAQAGLNEESYREQIRSNKLVEYAVKKAAEKELTDENYKKAFETYTPEVKAQIIQLTSEDKAKEVLEKAKAEGADFAQLAKENSADTSTKDKGGEVTFDSGSTTIPDAVKTAAFALEPNAVSDVITVQTSSSGAATYYIVKLNSKTAKSNNWKDYKKQLKEVILNSKQNDATFIRQVVTDELKEANIKVKDQAFQTLFAQYISSTDASSSSSASTSSSSTSSSSK